MFRVASVFWLRYPGHVTVVLCYFPVCLVLFVAKKNHSADGVIQASSTRSIHVCRRVDVRVFSNRTLSIPKSSLAHCARKCLGDSTCSSFNWKKSDHRCELVFHNGRAPVYHVDTDYVHYGPDVCQVRSSV